MGDPSLAESTKPYLDYLDKEMTIQGILSGFCVAAGALAFDRVLAIKADSPSSLVADLQSFSYPYALAAIVGLMTAAAFFYAQRSQLAWLHGQISLAVTREMQGTPAPPNTNSLADGIDIGDSWSLWSRYKFGISFLLVSAAEVALALFFADRKIDLGFKRWVLAGIPFLFAVIFDLFYLYVLNRRDERAAEAREEEVKNIRAAKERKLQSVTAIKPGKQGEADGRTEPPL